MKKIILILLTLLPVLSCNDDDTNDTGKVTIEFSNKIDTKDIILNTATYTNLSNESYTISELKYVISNIALVKENGEEFIYPVSESYFLINEEATDSKKLTLNNIIAAGYTQIKFGFGVDQSKYPLNEVNNFIPTAEENGMLWSWSAGYKFLKFEGTYTPQGGTTADYILHVGSHGTTLDNYKEIVLDLPTTLTVANGTNSTIAIDTNIAKIFDSTHSHSLQVKNEVQVDPENAPKLAENISTMFTATTVTN